MMYFSTRLSLLFINNCISQFKGIAKALFLFVIFAKRMLFSKRSISLYNSFKHLVKFFYGLIGKYKKSHNKIFYWKTYYFF